jgi:hypothetical protein
VGGRKEGRKEGNERNERETRKNRKNTYKFPRDAKKSGVHLVLAAIKESSDFAPHYVAYPFWKHARASRVHFVIERVAFVSKRFGTRGD